MTRRRLRLGVALAALLAIATATAAQGSTTRAASATELYIVQMELRPAVAYEGGVAGIPATKPAKGKKLDRTDGAVQRYVGHLKATHDAALSRVGGAEKVYDYTYVYNGFAARLTEKQAALLEKQKDVVAVVPNEMVSIDTSSTPKFLGLDAEGGIWDRLRGPKGNGVKGGAGEDIIIGVIDSGIWPDSASFSDRRIQGDRLGKVVYGPVDYLKLPDGWRGICQTGEQFDASHCNNKLIGARHFNAAFGGDAGLKALRPWEFASPRDYHGHGTHTASTAGGNHGVPATGAAAAFGKISGIAPRARIAAYKALWSSTPDAASANGGTVDLAAAVDMAVADGVDVINYSVSGTQTNFLDPVQVAFLWAADAGIFVSTSAGNNGPAAGSVAHPSPWLTTVAAETHDRVGAGEITTGGATYAGASAGTGSASGSLVTFGARASAERLCLLGSLTPAAAGKIVFCERGINARVEKSFEVQRVGGIGMVLVNPPAGGSLNADLHFVPSVHLQGNHYDAIEAAALTGATASISGQVLYGQPAPFMAAFSSRGPSSAAGNEVLKPDLGAPGVDVLAAVAPPGNRGREHDLYSGTSMSAPHVAGLAALFKQLHPTWSPMAIKSALMTTGSDVLETFAGTTASDEAALRAFAQGAGHVQPNRAMTPGLVYDSDWRDWFAFLCGTTTGVNANTCAALVGMGYSTSRTDVNTPSIALNNLAGARTVKRRVTNVTASTQTFTATGSAAGVAITATPSTLTLAPGETKSFEVTVAHTTAAVNRWTAGHLTWSNGSIDVRIPVVARPVTFGTPTEVSATTNSSVSWTVGIGYTGTLSAALGGLVPATTTAVTVDQDPDQTFLRTDPTGTFEYVTTVPAGATFRAATYHEDVSPGDSDLDLFVFRCTTSCTQVGSSESGTSTETVTHLNNLAAPAEYRVYVHGWSTGSAPQSTTTLHTWAVGTTPAGNATLSGVTSPVSPGTQTHTATFSGLAAGTRYLGRVDYTEGSTLRGRTLLSIRTP